MTLLPGLPFDFFCASTAPSIMITLLRIPQITVRHHKVKPIPAAAIFRDFTRALASSKNRSSYTCPKLQTCSCSNWPCFPTVIAVSVFSIHQCNPNPCQPAIICTGKSMPANSAQLYFSSQYSSISNLSSSMQERPQLAEETELLPQVKSELSDCPGQSLSVFSAAGSVAFEKRNGNLGMTHQFHGSISSRMPPK